MKYDWTLYTKEYVNGSFKTISEYIRWAEDRREQFREIERPGSSMIRKASAKLKWTQLRARREAKAIAQVMANPIDEAAKKRINELIQQKVIVNRALTKMLVHLANNPEQMQVKADLSDLVNDLKRGIGMETKEQQVQPTHVQMNQANIDADSFRRQLEDGTKGERKQLKERTERGIKKLETSISAEELEYLEVEDDD